jgi:hypothetical protein
MASCNGALLHASVTTRAEWNCGTFVRNGSLLAALASPVTSRRLAETIGLVAQGRLALQKGAIVLDFRPLATVDGRMVLFAGLSREGYNVTSQPPPNF